MIQSSPRIPISVVIPTLNEAPRIRSAIETVQWADEVIVADAGSTDGTPDIARSSGARVLTVPGPTIGAQRNAAIETARNPWILALDADEMVTPELRDAIADLCLTGSPRYSAYRVRSRNWHLGRELRHGPWGRDWKIRVFSSDQRFNASRVHERVEVGEVGELDGRRHALPRPPRTRDGRAVSAGVAIFPRLLRVQRMARRPRGIHRRRG